MTAPPFTPAASRVIGRAARAARERGRGVVDLPELFDAVAGSDDRFRVLLAFSEARPELVSEVAPASSEDALLFSAAVKERFAAAFEIARLSHADSIDVQHLAFAAAGWNGVASCLGSTAAGR